MSKILLVEDDSATRLLLKRDLQLAGYEVSVAKDGEEGLTKALQLYPALIICDWVMPLMDGVEVCRQVKASPELANTIFILLTSREAITDRVEGLDAGADDFLGKPVDVNELLARVRAGLRLYRYQQDLREANQQLNTTLRNLERAQLQLVQTEKMSSMGQLVAGVAHEINNPIGIIEGNLCHTKRYLSDLLGLIQLYQQYYPTASTEISDYTHAIDWEFTQTDFPKIIESMEISAARIRNLVLSLRNFSRLDEAEMKLVDIHEGLDSTLLMLQHRLQASGSYPGIKVIKDYGDLPKVECYPRQLNQVFLNILNNAIDALQHKLSKEPTSFATREVTTQKDVSDFMQELQTESPIHPTEQPDQEPNFRNYHSPILRQSQTPCITVQTQVINSQRQQTSNEEYSITDRAVIKISDNGSGMTPLVQQRLFDPFFTTKPVGQGTGLGLSISYQIVAQHHEGELKCSSELGQGTDLIIEIPVRQPGVKLPQDYADRD